MNVVRMAEFRVSLAALTLILFSTEEVRKGSPKLGTAALTWSTAQPSDKVMTAAKAKIIRKQGHDLIHLATVRNNRGFWPSSLLWLHASSGPNMCSKQRAANPVKPSAWQQRLFTRDHLVVAFLRSHSLPVSLPWLGILGFSEMV